MGAISIGGAQNTTVRNIDATIDDVQVYNSALLAADISTLYTTPGSVVPEPNAINLIGIMSFLGVFIRQRRRP